MSKLLLTSAGFENPKIGTEFLALINNNPATTKILFIPTASRTDKELYYLEKSKQELLEVGIKEENIIVYNLDYKLSDEILDKINVVYVCGGNTFYLLHKVKEMNFQIILTKLVQTGVIYVGASAGSLLAGPDIKISEFADVNDIGISDFSALNLTSTIILPHYSEERIGVLLRFKKTTNYPIQPLTDNQALLIVDETKMIIE